jgi:hypothetical protein
MTVRSWLRHVFRVGEPDEESVEREEYGTPDAGVRELERDRYLGFVSGEGTEAAEADLDELKPPQNPAR